MCLHHREDENECALLFEDEVMTQDFGSTDGRRLWFFCTLNPDRVVKLEELLALSDILRF